MSPRILQGGLLSISTFLTVGGALAQTCPNFPSSVNAGAGGMTFVGPPVPAGYVVTIRDTAGNTVYSQLQMEDARSIAVDLPLGNYVWRVNQPGSPCVASGSFAQTNFHVALLFQSENLPPVTSGVNGIQTTASRLELPTLSEYANFFNGSPPATPTIDFSKYLVLAATMGTSPLGSSIVIPGALIDTSGLTAGFGHASVVQNVGSGGTITGPVAVTGGTITNTGGQTTIANGTMTINGGTVTIMTTATSQGGTVVTITAVGATNTNIGGTTTTTGGTTTAVSGATNDTNTGGTTTNTGGTTTTTSTVIVTTSGTYSIFGGNVSTTPTGIVVTNGTVTVIGGNANTSGTTTTGGTTTITGGTTVANGGGTTQPFAVVEAPNSPLFYSFVNPVSIPPFNGSLLPFSSLSYKIGDLSTPYIESMTIDSAGHVTINFSRGTTGGTTLSGSLQQPERQAVGGAFLAANLAPLPPTITDPLSPQTPILPSETFTWVVNGVTHSITVQAAGFYGANSSLKALEDAIRGPVERIKQNAGGFEIEGTVRVNGPTLTVGGVPISHEDPFYSLLASLFGKEVELEAQSSPTGTSVLSVGTHLIAPGTLQSFPSTGAPVLTTLSKGTGVQVTDATLFGTYFEVSANEERGFVPASAIVVGPSIATQATIRGLLFQKYLQQGGLIWDGTGGAPPFTTGWVNPATGQSAPAPTENQWQVSAGDPDHAVNINTGQNAFYNPQTQQWFDSGTGLALSQSGNSPASLQGLTFQIYLQEGGLIWDGTGGAPPFTTGWVNPATGQSAPAPTENQWQVSAGDPDHVVNINTGQNAFCNPQTQQWFDAATGQSLSPSLK
jgi:hypothetical protein